MTWQETPDRTAVYRLIPKVELHRHLEGSLRLQTLLSVASKHGITLPLKLDLRSMVQMQEGDPLTYANFLSKFQTLRMFYLSPEVIRRITHEAVEDAANDQVRYLELRFTPSTLGRPQGFSMKEVMDWVCESAQKASREFGIITRLIPSVNRHDDPEIAKEVAGLALERMERGIVALDLAGNEADFPAQPFLETFRRAKAGGLAITIHAGEWGGAENVRQALEDFEADRIGHGVRVMEDPQVVELARQRQTPFEVCITSNYQSGVVPALSEHPVGRMLAAGLNVTINTDDPSISKITLGDEYRLVCQDLGLTLEMLQERILAAARAAFLKPEEKDILIQYLKKSF